MRFNDEVQFTLMCVRVPEPVALSEPVAQPCVFTECMTQGDVLGAKDRLPLHIDLNSWYVIAQQGARLNEAADNAAAEKMFPPAPANTLLTKTGHKELINKMLDATVSISNGHWAKVAQDYEAAMRGNPHLYPDPSLDAATRIAPRTAVQQGREAEIRHRMLEYQDAMGRTKDEAVYWRFKDEYLQCEKMLREVSRSVRWSTINDPRKW